MARGKHPGGGKARTKQADALDTDIDRLVNRFVAHLHAPDPNRAPPTYGDFSNVDDFHTAMNKVKSAEDSFMRLPSAVRKHVNNDPGEFLSMVNDPERKEELVDLGLLPQDEPAPSTPAPEPPTPVIPPE